MNQFPSEGERWPMLRTGVWALLVFVLVVLARACFGAMVRSG